MRLLLTGALGCWASCGGGASVPAGVDGGDVPPADLDASVVQPHPDVDASQIGPTPSTDALPGDTAGPVLAKRKAQILSVPPSFVLKNEAYSYVPKHSLAGDTDWTIVQAPAGMIVRERRIVADPDTLPAGEHTVVIEARVEDVIVRQSYPLTVGTIVQRAARRATPAESTHVAVQSDTSRVRRAGVSVPVGAVAQDTDITINEVDRAPRRASYRVSGPVVDFGPSGTVFRRGATVALPMDATMTNPQKVGAFTYDTHAGRWEPVEVLGVDIENKLVFAKAAHFSMYMAGEPAVALDNTVGLLSNPARCEGRVSVQSVLAATATDVPLGAVNNLSPEMLALLPAAKDTNGNGMTQTASTLADLFGTGKFRGTLRVVFVVSLMDGQGANASVLDAQVRSASVFVGEDGGALVRVTDALGNVIETKTFTDLTNNLPEIWKRLSGATTHAVFGAVPARSLSAGTRVHLLHFGDDRTAEPISLADVGMALVESQAGPAEVPAARAADFDQDCDHLLGAFDAEDGRSKLIVAAEPAGVATVTVGQTVRLSASLLNADGAATTTWDAGAGTLAPVANDGAARMFSAREAGRYTVSFKAVVGSQQVNHVFAVDVVAPAIMNTPPICTPFASTSEGVVEEAVGCKAVLADRESPAETLTVQWGLVDPGADAVSTADDTLVPSGLVTAAGSAARLVLGAQGRFVVGCRAHDGKTWGPVGSVAISALPKNTNQPPQDVFLSPPVADLLLGESVRLTIRARDPERKPLTFAWTAKPNTDAYGVPVLGTRVDGNDRSEVVVTPTQVGVIEVLATVSDGEFTSAPHSARIIVRSKAPSKVDMDADGFSAGTGPGEDCNDGNRAVHPDAVEVCGNDVDENCDGVVNKDDCDRDGFASCAAATGTGCDCNDADANTHPGMRELCDARDNNCDGAVDEGFMLGGTCTVGLGVCQATGKSVCSGDGHRAVCSGTPAPSNDEVCDGRDNDCDGAADEDNVCAKDLVGVYFECATPAPNEDPARYANCAILDMEGFELRQDGVLVLLSAPRGVVHYDPQTPYCHYNEGTWRMKSATTLVARLPDRQTGSIEEQIVEIVARTPDRLDISMVSRDTNMSEVQHNRRVAVNSGGMCTFEPGCRPLAEICNQADDDCDGQTDEGLDCPLPCDKDGVDNDRNGTIDEAGERCGPMPVSCDMDKVDNDKNGTVDERGEPCMPPCDRDGLDNDGNGKVDEAGEACAMPAPCDRDQRDNDGDGWVDEAGEPCQGEPVPCNKDGADNDRDGTIDEADEACASLACDMDEVDNDKNGTVDERGEPCAPPCDRDGIDNNGNGKVDEAGEICSAPPPCDRDGLDNDGDGWLDEAGEPCQGEPVPCNKDGVDNDRDGTIDEADEACAAL